MSCHSQDNDFYKIVLNDFSRQSYYIFLKISNDSEEHYAIIENSNLFLYLTEKKALKKDSYYSYMKDILENDKLLKIDAVDKINDIGFILVQKCSDVDSTIKMGRKKFLETYFKDDIINDNIIKDKIPCIIKELFKWKIPIKVDDESGYLMITK